MDPTRFDTVIRDLTQRMAPHPTRRAVLGLVGGVLGVGLTRAPEALARHHKHHHHGGGGGGGGGGCLPNCAGAACGSDGCGGSCGSCGQGQSCQDGTCVGGGGGGGGCDPTCGFNTVCQDGTCVAAADICAGPTGICNADPTPCGHAATGETCGCEQTVEGNTFCANGGDNVCTDVECSSSQDCFDGPGFHFFCQEAKTNANGQFCGCGFGTATGRVCVAECDNTGAGGGGDLGVFEICDPDANACQADLRCDSPTTKHTCSDTVAGIDTWCCVPPGGPCTECECCGNFSCDFGDANPDGACRPNSEGGGGGGGACQTSGDCSGNTPDCCGGACVDTLGDNNHCGGCDSPCPAGQTCGAGVCNP